MDFATAASLPNCVRMQMKTEESEGEKPKRKYYIVLLWRQQRLRWFCAVLLFPNWMSVRSFHAIYIFLHISSSTTMWCLIFYFFSPLFHHNAHANEYVKCQMNANFLQNGKYIMLLAMLHYDRVLFSSGFVRPVFSKLFKTHTRIRAHKRRKQRSENERKIEYFCCCRWCRLAQARRMRVTSSNAPHNERQCCPSSFLFSFLLFFNRNIIM